MIGKMIFNKKGQAAMEFLMTYGWALLVVLIAIAALAFFGLLNPARFLPEKCEIAPGLTCMDFTASSDETVAGSEIIILLNNGIGQTMKGANLSVSDCNTSAVIATFVEGDTEQFSIDDCNNMVPNTRFKADMTLAYNTTVEGITLTHSKQGYLVVQVEAS